LGDIVHNGLRDDRAVQALQARIEVGHIADHGVGHIADQVEGHDQLALLDNPALGYPLVAHITP
jgi:hypothetical protein